MEVERIYIMREKWTQRMQYCANSNDGVFSSSENSPIGDFREYYTNVIKFNEKYNIFLSQSAVIGSEFFPSYLKFEAINNHIYNFNLSLYQKGFLERIFSNSKVKSGNQLFDKKFGIYSTDKETAIGLFKDSKVQNIFLNNKFLLFNIQKDNSTVTLKSMETKLYKEAELQELLDNFIYILNIANNRNK